MLLRRQRTYCVTLSPKNPCEFFGHFFPHSWEFLVQIFRTYYAFLSTTPEHTFIQWPATLTKLCHIMHDHSVHIICSNVHLRPQWPMLGRHSDAHPAYTPVRHGPIYLYPLQGDAVMHTPPTPQWGMAQFTYTRCRETQWCTPRLHPSEAWPNLPIPAAVICQCML